MLRSISSLSYLLAVVFVAGLTVACQQKQEKNARTNTQKASLSASTDTLEIERQWELTADINRPESAVYHSEKQVVYVSNMVGGATAKDGKGYISKITSDGKMLDPRWVEGLDAPKGLAIHGGYLYASDINRLVKIDLNTGQIAGRYSGEGAKFLNDVTVDTAGNVYVSDSRTNTIYRLHDDSFKVWIEGDSIQSPNGLYAEPDRLVVAAGNNKTGKGRLLQAIDYQTKQVRPLGKSETIGGIDGIQPNGRGGYFLTDWSDGTLMNYQPERGLNTLKTISRGTADLDYIADQHLIVLPVMMSNRILGFSVQ